MDYKDRLDFIKSKIDKTKDKEKLKEFLDSIKTSDLKPEDKARFIDELEIKITGRKFTNKQAMQDILDAMPEIDDIN